MLLIKDKRLKEAFEKAFFEVTKLLREEEVRRAKELEEINRMILEKVEKARAETRKKIEELKRKKGLL